MPEEASEQRIGYKNPPEHTRYKPRQSGNLNGRPKRPPTFATDLLAELAELVSVPGDARVQITKQRLLVKALIDAASGGDMRAMSVIVGVRASVPEPQDKDNDAPEDHELLEDYVRQEVERRKTAESPSEPPAKSNES
jgi:uncharacterized protein DUF5681